MITLVPITVRWVNTSLGTSDAPRLTQVLSATLQANVAYSIETSEDTINWTLLDPWLQGNTGGWSKTIDPAATPQLAYRIRQN